MMSVSLSLLATTTVLVAGPATPASADPNCINGGAYLLWARGSNAEFLPNGGSAPEATRAFKDHINYALGVAGVNSRDWAELGNLNGDFDSQNNLDSGEYPAKLDFPPGPVYSDSLNKGIAELVTHLQHRYGTATGNWVSNCHNETLVLGGYSQGADVIRDALWQLPGYVKDNIGYVALYGDPRHDPGGCDRVAWWERGDANCHDGTIWWYPRRSSYVSNEYFNRFGSWCGANDHYCAYHGDIYGGDHGTAYQNFWIQQSAAEVAAAARNKQCSLNPNMCPGTRLMGDVNGDGRKDAVVMFRDSGTAMVAASNGSSFGGPTSWCYLHTVGADRYFLADVNGDNRDDLLAFWGSNGMWRVSLSSGSGFWPEQEWAWGHGVGTSRQFVAKVNNDNMADIVTYDQNTGDWWVSTSGGTGFWPPSRWISGHGVGSNDQFVADFNADGRSDAAVYIASGGNWHVGLSNGVNGFGYPPSWSAGHGHSSNKRLVGDVSGDGRADAVYYYNRRDLWDVGTASAQGGFWSPTAWANDHGHGSTEQFIASVTNDGMADLVTYRNGYWWVSPSSGSGFWGPPQLWRTGHGAGS